MTVGGRKGRGKMVWMHCRAIDGSQLVNQRMALSKTPARLTSNRRTCPWSRSTYVAVPEISCQPSWNCDRGELENRYRDLRETPNLARKCFCIGHCYEKWARRVDRKFKVDLLLHRFGHLPDPTCHLTNQPIAKLRKPSNRGSIFLSRVVVLNLL